MVLTPKITVMMLTTTPTRNKKIKRKYLKTKYKIVRIIQIGDDIIIQIKPIIMQLI